MKAYIGISHSYLSESGGTTDEASVMEVEEQPLVNLIFKMSILYEFIESSMTREFVISYPYGKEVVYR